MSEKQKVLISGDVNGRFKFLFNKVEAINKKSGPFEMLLCVGEFFGKNNSELEIYKSGLKNIPLQTYFIGPSVESNIKSYPDSDGCDICHNLTYLGKRGLYTLSSGLKIAYLSGVENLSNESNEGNTFNESDVEAIKNSCFKTQSQFRGIDILLTSQWPQDVTNLDEDKPNFQYNGSRLVSWLSSQIKPRYHVCGLENIDYERPPYRNEVSNEDGSEIVTRFISLAAVGNSDKKRWIYALNLTPVDRIKLSELMQKTTDETLCPYSKSLLKLKPEKRSKDQFFYDMDSKDEKQKHKKSKFEFDKKKCWFCLSSPDVAKHLVISVGKEVYLALAKGGVVDDHFLILPIDHYQSLSTLPNNIKEEFNNYKETIKKYYATSDRVPVFFERNFKTSHCQLQAVPIHKNQAADLKNTFEEIASVYHIRLQELDKDLSEAAPSGTLYFYAELPDKQGLFYKIKKDFPLQFGREVVCSDRILDIPHRFDWKDCQLDKSQEYVLAEKIKAQFQKFDGKCES